jgi:hypothetical protein
MVVIMEVTYGTASYAYTYDRHLQTFQVGVNYVNYGSFEGYDESGQPTTSFTGSEITFSRVCLQYSLYYYSYRVNAKLISSTLETIH